MSRTFVCLFMLFILSIAVRFGECESSQPNAECDAKNIIPGSDYTRLVHFEKLLSKTPFSKISEEDNSEFIDTEFFDKFPKDFNTYLSIIQPGTRWCGAGDRAKNDDDLGLFKGTDACCREHDKCQHNILAGETKINLVNNGRFTRSACACEVKFYKCLKAVNSLIGYKVGKTYFNMLGPQCFKCVCPEEGCNLINDEVECMDRCKKYEWVDNPKY